MSAAEPTALPAPVSSTAADATTPVVAPVASTLKPFIARPGPAAAAASPDAAKSTNPADKPQYVFTWFLNNYLGTTIASSNAAEEIAEIETDAFGAPLARGTLPADMRYTGKPYDEDMGAYIFPFRNYRPDEARWITPDPSGFPDGANNYVYEANPMREVDPYGLDVIVLFIEDFHDGPGGHTAILVGQNSNDPGQDPDNANYDSYEYYSFGPGHNTHTNTDNLDHHTFVGDFNQAYSYNVIPQLQTYRLATGFAQFDYAYEFICNPTGDSNAISAALAYADTDYRWFRHNCTTMVDDALVASGISAAKGLDYDHLPEYWLGDNAMKADIDFPLLNKVE